MSATGKAESYVELRGSITKPDAIVGKSAYEIAVANGFKGTEQEWLESLKNGGGSVEFATNAEVIKILDEVYGENADNLPEDEIPITTDDLASDEEVLSMLNGVFGDK